MSKDRITIKSDMMDSIHWEKDSSGDELFECVIHVDSIHEIKTLQNQILKDYDIVNRIKAVKRIIDKFPNIKCTNATFSKLLQAVLEE